MIRLHLEKIGKYDGYSKCTVREEMEYIKERQQELAAEGREGNEREFWKLQIVWEYLRDKLAHKGNGYLN